MLAWKSWKVSASYCVCVCVVRSKISIIVINFGSMRMIPKLEFDVILLMSGPIWSEFCLHSCSQYF